MKKIQTICVCGGGTMGKGIAQVVARAGFTTILFELNLRVLQLAREELEVTLQSLVDKGKLGSAEKQRITGLISYTADARNCRADLIIEAIIEDPGAKTKLFNQLAEFNEPATIFATNTSSLSITSLAEKTDDPGRVIGLHFFNPASLMKLVEVVAVPQTRPAGRNSSCGVRLPRRHDRSLCHAGTSPVVRDGGMSVTSPPAP